MGKVSKKRKRRSRSSSSEISRLKKEMESLKKQMRRSHRYVESEDYYSDSEVDDCYQPRDRRYYNSETRRREKSRTRSSERSLQLDPTSQDGSVNNDSEKQEDVLKTNPLDEETLELLGAKVSSLENNDLFLHPEIGDRWQIWSQDGLKKGEKLDLLKKHSRKGNYNFEAPELNPEVEASVNDSVKKRDKFFVADQNVLGSAIAALGTGVSVLLNNKSDESNRSEALKYLLDAGKLLSDSFHRISKTRKAFVYPSLDRKAKDLLEREKTDIFLFGKDLSTRLKTAKSMEKVGLSLKTQQQVSKKLPSNNKPSSSGNWKAPPVRDRGFFQAGYRTRNYYHRDSSRGRQHPERYQHRNYPPQSQIRSRENNQQQSQKQ